MNSSLSVVLAGYNEEANIELAVKESIDMLESNYEDYELILVNDASKDQSALIMQQLADSNSKIKYMENYINLNFGTSVLRGMLMAEKDYVMFNAMDLPLDPSLIPNYLTIMKESNADVLVLEREGYKTTKWRKITSNVNHLMLCVLFPKLVKNTPVMNYIQIYKRDKLNCILPLARSPIFVWPELIFRAKLNEEYQVMNVKAPCQVNNLRKGAFGKPHDIIWGIYDMLRFRIRLWKKSI